MPPAGEGDADLTEYPPADFRLTKEERGQLPGVLADMFPSQELITDLLTRDMGVPARLVSLMRSGESIEGYWRRVLDQLDAEHTVGSADRQLFLAVERRLGRRQRFDTIYRRLRSEDPGTEPVPAAAEGWCHAVMWTGAAAERASSRQLLGALQLAPREVWRSREMSSFEVDVTDAGRLASLIGKQEGNLLVKVVPRGQTDKLIENVTVFDAGDRSLLVDVPNHFTVTEAGAAAARLHLAEASELELVAGPGQQFAVHSGDGVRNPRLPMTSTLVEAKVRPGHRITIGSLKFRRIRVVFGGASPLWFDRLRLGEEAEAISHAARLGHIELVGHFSQVTRAHVAKIMRAKPDIIHIACHGRDGLLYWEDEDGNQDDLGARWLADAIADRADGRTLGGIVLTACEGQSIKPYFEGIARDVIAFNGALADKLAVKFTKHFYNELFDFPVLRTAADRAAKDLPGVPPITPDTQAES